METETSIFVDTFKGVIAGIVASIVFAGLLYLKNMAGIVPDLDLLSALMKLAGTTSTMTGWIIFFVINAVIIGALFASLDAHLERPEGAEELVRGALFGVGLWLLVMIFLMPMAGSGSFGMNLGPMAPIVTFIVFIIYGMVLGGVYGALRPEPVME